MRSRRRRPRLEALILGVGDLAASQGVHARHIGADVSGDEPYPYPGDIWHYARERMVVAARAHGLDPIDSPYSNFSDAEGYRRGAAWAATLGAVGKRCIHPSQIEIANESFSPSQDQIRQARKVVRAVEDAVRDGRGAASFDGVLIDAATSRIFQTVLDRAAVLGIDG